MHTRSLRRYTILIACILCLQTLWGQRRFEVSEPEEYKISDLLGYTFKDPKGKIDAFWGLHASQYSGSHHLLGFSAEGAWSSFANNMPTASIIPGGGAAGLHFLYEYQYSGLLIHTGIGVNYQHVFNNVCDTDFYHYGMQDKWQQILPADFTLKHEFRHRRDLSRNMYVQIPLYVGVYMFSSAGVWYWLGGFHFSKAFLGCTNQYSEGTTMADYEPFLGIWHEMDNHGYRDSVPIERSGKRLDLKFDIMLHGEFGYEITTYRGPHNYRSMPGDRIDCRFRFAAFADFGMLDINPRTNNALYYIPQENIYDFPTYRMDHVFSTTDAKPYWLRNLYVGIRLTVLFGLPHGEKCILCDPWKH